MAREKGDHYYDPFPTQLRLLLDGNSERGEVTQAQLAKDLKVTRQTISLYVNGNTKPDFETFKAIADYFDVPYEFLFGVTNSVKKENIDIAAKTGLTDKAIENLVSLKRRADLEREEQEQFEQGISDDGRELYLSEFKNEPNGPIKLIIINCFLEKDKINRLSIPILNYITNVRRLRSKRDGIHFLEKLINDPESGIELAIPSTVTLDELEKLQAQNKISQALELESIQDEIERAEWSMSKFLTNFAVVLADEIIEHFE